MNETTRPYDLDDYEQHLKRAQQHFAYELPEDFRKQVSDDWYERLAPFKTRLYGMDNWMRLGVRGIIAELSGCYHRWKSLCRYAEENGGFGEFVDPVDRLYDSVMDAIRDTWGYGQMYLYAATKSPAWTHGDLLPMVVPDKTPEELMEWLIQRVWFLPDGYMGSAGLLQSTVRAATLAPAMWLNTEKTWDPRS